MLIACRSNPINEVEGEIAEPYIVGIAAYDPRRPKTELGFPVHNECASKVLTTLLFEPRPGMTGRLIVENPGKSLWWSGARTWSVDSARYKGAAAHSSTATANNFIASDIADQSNGSCLLETCANELLQCHLELLQIVTCPDDELITSPLSAVKLPTAMRSRST